VEANLQERRRARRARKPERTEGYKNLISSFTQFIWLPKYLGIEMYSEDHALHHTDPNCNYAKKAFGHI